MPDEPGGRDGVSLIVSERVYYEQESLWAPETYATDDQQARFEQCGLLVPENAATLLDVGSGQGSFLRWLELNRPALKLYGLERSEAGVARSVSETQIQLGSIEAASLRRSIDRRRYCPRGPRAPALRCLRDRRSRAHQSCRSRHHRLRPVRREAPNGDLPALRLPLRPSYHMRSFEPRDFAALFDGFTLDRQHVLSWEDHLGGPYSGGRCECSAARWCPETCAPSVALGAAAYERSGPGSGPG